MKKAVFTAALFAAAVSAQIVETTPFRAVLQSSGGSASSLTGAATILVQTVRDSSGQITSGSIIVSPTLRAAESATVTGINLQAGADANSSIAINLGSNPISVGTTASTFERQSSFTSDPSALRALLQNPSGYSLNVQTSAGTSSGQLHRARKLVLMGLMRPENEIPPQMSQPNSFGVGSIVAYASYNDAGVLSSGEVFFDVDVYHGQAATFTGLHIHTGGPNVNGPVTIGTNLSAANPVQAPASGIVNIRRRVEVDLNNAAARSTLEGLYSHPHDYYINLHSSTLPAGVIRSQLRNTDAATFNTLLRGADMTSAASPAKFTVHTIRGADSTVQAAVVTFDAAARLAANDSVTSFTLDTGSPTQPVPIISSGITTDSPEQLTAGAGAIHRFVTVSTLRGTGMLDDLLSKPALFFLTLRSANAAGPLMGPMAVPSRAMPMVGAVISAVSDPQLTTIAQGGLATIFGSNFAAVNQDLSSFEGMRLPTSINGVGVRIGRLPVPVLFAGPGHMIVQVPFEVPAGPQPVEVFTPNGVSTAFTARVAAVAPALYFGPQGAVATRLDFTHVSSAQPAQASELVWLWATGLGITNSGAQLITGETPHAEDLGAISNVTATVGGRAADVLHAVPTPGHVGLYQVLVRIPSGLNAGTAPVSITVGGATSNTVSLPVQ